GSAPEVELELDAIADVRFDAEWIDLLDRRSAHIGAEARRDTLPPGTPEVERHVLADRGRLREVVRIAADLGRRARSDGVVHVSRVLTPGLDGDRPLLPRGGVGAATPRPHRAQGASAHAISRIHRAATSELADLRRRGRTRFIRPSRLDQELV